MKTCIWGFFFPVSEQTVKAMTYLSESKQQTFFVHQNIAICSRETDLFKCLSKENCSSFHSLTVPLQQAYLSVISALLSRIIW